MSGSGDNPLRVCSQEQLEPQTFIWLQPKIFKTKYEKDFTELWYLLCAFRLGNISSDDSIGTGCDDVGLFGILCLICTEEEKEEEEKNKSVSNREVMFAFLSVSPLLPIPPLPPSASVTHSLSHWPLWWVNYVSWCGWKAIKAVTFVNHRLYTPQCCLLLQDEVCQHFTESPFQCLDLTNGLNRVSASLCGRSNCIQSLRVVLARAENWVATLCFCREE